MRKKIRASGWAALASKYCAITGEAAFGSSAGKRERGVASIWAEATPSGP